MFSTKNLDPNTCKLDQKSNKNIFIYNIGYVTVKDLSYTKFNSVNPSYFFIDKINVYIEESNRNKYLTLVSSDKSKDTLSNLKNYCGIKSEISLDQKLIIHKTMMRNI